jgi:hypothetical protein
MKQLLGSLGLKITLTSHMVDEASSFTCLTSYSRENILLVLVLVIRTTNVLVTYGLPSFICCHEGISMDRKLTALLVLV